MFTGLTSQVSTWIAKKADDGNAEIPSEEKISSPVNEETTEESKNSPTKTSNRKLEMLAGVKNQMSGWLSGGIPGLGRGNAEGEGESQAATNEAAPNTQASLEEIKDDDASSATGGADSGPDSCKDDEKNGQQPFGAVSTKALAGAKTFGGFLYSAVNKAGKSVMEAGVKIKKSVEENRLVSEINKENQQNQGEAVVAPWVGAPNEEVLQAECLSLSLDKSNFLRPPPEGVDFEWNLEAALPTAQAVLAIDNNLENMRYQLVPKEISEENFWRNYFYRLSLLRQSHELNTMADLQNKEMGETINSSEVTTDEAVNDGATRDGLGNCPNNEFVSDSLRASDTDLEEVRKGMIKLGMQPPKEEDWERDLEAELKDYEVVASNEDKNIVAATGKDNGDWQKQIDEFLLTNEVDEDLK